MWSNACNFHSIEVWYYWVICRPVLTLLYLLLTWLLEIQRLYCAAICVHCVLCMCVTRRNIEFLSLWNVKEMCNFLKLSESRQFQNFRDISWCVLGKILLTPEIWPIMKLSCIYLNVNFPGHFLDMTYFLLTLSAHAPQGYSIICSILYNGMQLLSDIVKYMKQLK